MTLEFLPSRIASSARRAGSLDIPRPRVMRVVIALALLPLASCVTSAFDSAPKTCETDSGTVRGYTTEDVAEVGRLVREFCPRVRELLSPKEPEPVRVVVVRSVSEPFPRPYTRESARDGRALGRLIIVGSESRHLRGFIVGHELVHWYADGVWDRLPLALEEGLADLIACELDPVGREAKEYDLAMVRRAATFDEIESALTVSRESWISLSSAERSRVYWVGSIVARRLGIEGLRALSSTATADGLDEIPIARVLATTGLGTDPRNWNDAAREQRRTSSSGTCAR